MDVANLIGPAWNFSRPLVVTFVTAITTAAAITCLTTNAWAQEERDYEVVAEDLSNPRAVAIQPETGHLFVAESGAQRVVRIIDGTREEVVTGFSKDYTGKSPIYEIGPLSMYFIDRNTLLISDGGREAGMDQIRVVTVPKVGEPPIVLKREVNKTLRLQADGQHQANGNFWGMARLGDYIFVTCGDDMRQGWVARFPIRSAQPGQLKRFFSTVRAADAMGPYAITASPEGDLAIAQTGGKKDVGDSLLLFFGSDGAFLDSFETGLNDIYGLAYGPNQGRLYAVDFNQARPNEGGLYKLVGTREGCRSIRFATISRPTAMAFAENGDLYVTTVGRFAEGTESSNGRLLRFTGLDGAKE